LSVPTAAKVRLPPVALAGTSTSNGIVTEGTEAISPPSDAVTAPLSAPSTRTTATSSLTFTTKRTVVPGETTVPGVGSLIVTTGGSSLSRPTTTGVLSRPTPTTTGVVSGPMLPDVSIARATTCTAFAGIVNVMRYSPGAAGLDTTPTNTPSTKNSTDATSASETVAGTTMSWPGRAAGGAPTLATTGGMVSWVRNVTLTASSARWRLPAGSTTPLTLT